MAEKQAEDDDDEGFGDFKFASSYSYPNHTVHSNHMNGSNFFNEENDDEWGDFINHSFSQVTAQSQLSKPFDDFGFFTDHSTKPSDSVPSLVKSESTPSTPIRVEAEKKEWVKPQGALPLSIFGGMEEEEEGSDVGNASIGDATDLFTSKHVDSVKNGSSSIPVLGIDDIIATLYNQGEQIKVENGSNSNSIGLDSNMNGLNTIANQFNQSEQIKVGNGSTSNSNGLDSNLNGLNSKFIENLYNQSERIEGDNGLNSNTNGPNSAISNGLMPDSSEFNLNVNGLDSNIIEGNDDDDDDGWEFKAAVSGKDCGDENSKEEGSSGLLGLEVEATTIDREIQVDGKCQTNSEGGGYSLGFGSSAHVSSDMFASSNGFSHKSSEMDFGFGFEPSAVVQNGFLFNSFSESKLSESGNELNSNPIDGNADSDVNFWELKDAFSQTESKHKEEAKVADLSCAGVDVSSLDGEIQVSKISSENHEGALPLSLFSDGKLESYDSLNHQDDFAYKPSSYPRNGMNSHGSSMPFDDLIMNLYSQAEKIPSVDSVDSTQKPTVNGLVSTETVLDSNIVNGDDDFDDSSWEFKDAFLDGGAKDQTSVLSLGDTHQNVSTKLKVENHVEFYSKLKDESCLVALCHLDCQKKARTSAALSSEDAKVVVFDEEIQEAYKELHQENVVLEEVCTEKHPPGISCLNEFLEVLLEPKFQVLESEYHLSRRLPLAEKDLRSAIELFKHATSILKVLTLASKEEQSSYVSTWSKIISICAQELKHGASIWKQSLQKSIHSQILSEPRGQQFILALGEIYRVVEILGASAKLYKPWILSSFADPKSIFALLEECYALWSSSGLEEALHSISDPTGSEYYGTVKTLLESIKHIHDLDTCLQNHSLAKQEPICRLSVLTPTMVPDMKIVVWNGEHYFLTLANLWANLISCHPPMLPHIDVS